MPDSNVTRRVKIAIAIIVCIAAIQSLLAALLIFHKEINVDGRVITAIMFRDFIGPFFLALFISISIVNGINSHKGSVLSYKQSVVVGLSRALLLMLIANLAMGFGRGFARGFFGD